MEQKLNTFLNILWIKSGLSYRDIAKISGISEGGTYKLLTGENSPRVITAYKLLSALNSNFTDFEAWLKTRSDNNENE